MNQALIGQIAGFLTLIQVIPYIVSILRGRTKPERASYFIWLIVNVLSISTYISAGARTTIWTGIVLSLTGLIVFLLSLKYGIGGFSKFDKLCLLLGLSGAAVWIYTDNPVIALYFITFVGAIGYLPTLKKTYFMPKTENKLSWLLTAAAGIINLFAISSLELKIILPVVCAAFLQSCVVSLILFPGMRYKHSRKKPHKFHVLLSHPVFVK